MAFNSEMQIPKLPGLSVPSSAVRMGPAKDMSLHATPHAGMCEGLLGPGARGRAGCAPCPNRDCARNMALALTVGVLESNCCSLCGEITRSRRALPSRMASACSRRERKRNRQNQRVPSPAHRACTRFPCLLPNGMQHKGIFGGDSMPCSMPPQRPAGIVIAAPAC